MPTRNTYTRRNAKGDKEFVVQKKGKQDEETLNELADIISDLLEDIAFSGPLPAGGGAGSPEQLQYQRNRNQPDAPLMVGARGDGVRMAGESPNNMTASTSQVADGPERSRAKSKLRANPRGTPPRNKYISGYYGDNIDYGATHSESFTGTGAIAIGPGSYQVKDDSDEEEDTESEESKTENTMSRKDVINEWDPAFKAAGYEPGDYQMPSPTGDGVAKRKAKQDTVGKYDTGTKSHGKEWPRDHNETAAMCDVDEDGVEGKPQGAHESSVGDPKDGHQSELGHNWPDQPKNDGGGVAEPFDGKRWSDGGTLSGGSGQDEFNYKTGGVGMPKDGQITGTKGPQLGQPQESWSPELIGTLIGEDHDLQGLFDAYARKYRMVCLEDFQALCHAHGIDMLLDEASILKLMSANNEFIFYEGVDANGSYWTPTPIAEGNGKPWEKGCDKCGADPCECEDDDCGLEEGRQRPFDRPINELQVRSPQDEAVAGNLNDREEDAEFGDWATGNDYDDSMGVGSMDEFGGDEDLEGMPGNAGPGPYGMHNAPYDECPECGYTGMEDVCPECGGPMGEAGGMGEEDIEDFRDLGAWDPEAVDEIDEFESGGYRPGAANPLEVDQSSGMRYPKERWDEGERMPFEGKVAPDGLAEGMNERERAFARKAGRRELGLSASPMGSAERGERRRRNSERQQFIARQRVEDKGAMAEDIRESLTNFMQSARHIIGSNKGGNTKAIGEALNQSWKHYVGGFDPRQAPSKVQASLQELAKIFPSFDPLAECAMDKPDGTALGGGDGPKDGLPDQPSETTEMGEPLGKKQKNVYDVTPIIKGTEKGLTGNSKSVKENAEKLAKYIRKQLQESAPGMRGKYQIQFTCLVQESDGSVNRTDTRTQLAEAVADLEELLQVHGSDDVVLEAYFVNGQRTVLKHNIPMVPVAKHGPLVSEDSALFRFNRHAEQYADNLVSEGFTCKLVPHSWGSAVQVLSEKKKWIQKAINPEHEGYCTPMTKSTCTPRRKALAKRFKKGGDLHSGD